MPLTFGIFRPRIVLPVEWKTWSHDSRSLILTHELAHIRRLDNEFRIIQIVVQAVYFFHPLIWILNRKINEFREMACDDASTGPNHDLSMEYTRLLIRLAENLKQTRIHSVPFSALMKKRNELLNRIRYQMEGSMKKISRIKTLILSVLLLLLIIPFSFTKSQADQQVAGSQEPDSGAVIQGTVRDNNHLPMKDALIRIQNTSYSAETDENGAFEIQGIPVGSCTLQIFRKDIRVYEYPFRIFNLKDVYKLNFDLDIKENSGKSGSSDSHRKVKESVSAQAQTSGRIFGTVTDRETGMVLAGANVMIASTQLGTATDESGQYSLLLEPGTADLQAGFIGYSSILIKDIIVRQGQSLQIDLELQPSVIPFSKIREQVRKSESRNMAKSTSPSVEESPDSISFIPFDTPPEPVGGFAELQNKIVYPHLAQEGKIEGKVIVQAEIDENGTVRQTRIVQSLEPSGCDQAAKNAIQSVLWKPAMMDGTPIKAWITIPIEFRLN